MNVLFGCYQHVGLGRGGMFHQITHTKNALEQLGVNVIVHDFMRSNLDSIDVCHIFSTSLSNHELIKYCSRNNIPVIMSTVYNNFSQKHEFWHSIEYVLAKHLPAFLIETKSLIRISQLVSRYIVLNKEEEIVLKKCIKNIGDIIRIIPNGYDEKMIAPNPISKTKKIVLNVGEVNPRKNQLNLIKAAENQPWNLSIVGPLKDTPYVRQCISLSHKMKNVNLTGELPYGSNTLKELYSDAKVFCLPSLSEVQPLTLIEAAGYNCNIVVSSTVPVQNCLEKQTITVDPADWIDIRKGINAALNKESSTWESIKNEPTWTDVALNLINTYKEVILESKNR